MSTESAPTFWAALAAAQAEFPPLRRDREVTVTMKTGGRYTFAYATLEACLACVRPALAKHGLALTTPATVGDGTVTVTARVSGHGEHAECALSWPKPGALQDLGSALTYLRRYAVSALLCLAADDDNDGNEASGNEAMPRKVSLDKPVPPSGNDVAGMERVKAAGAYLRGLGSGVGDDGKDVEGGSAMRLALMGTILGREVKPSDVKSLTVADCDRIQSWKPETNGGAP